MSSQVHILAERLAAGVDLQNVVTALDIGQTDVHLPVKAAGAQQRVIENVGAVRRRHDDDALVVVEAVHFHEQLVERLLALVVAAAETGAALTADGVDLVDEHDGGGDLLGLLEQVAHAARADADVQLHKVGAGDGQKFDARLAGDGLGEQRLARARRADEQHALGDARAHLGIRRRGFAGYSTISCSSSFSSSAPATSANVFFCFSSLPRRVRALENFITPPAPPPPCAERIMEYHSTPMMTKMMRYGTKLSHQAASHAGG